jgi:hypothetical protein
MCRKFRAEYGGVVGGVLNNQIDVLFSDEFHADENEGLVGRPALLGNNIVNFPYDNYLAVVITSSWAAAVVFVLMNMLRMFWIPKKQVPYFFSGIVVTVIVVLIGIMIIRSL